MATARPARRHLAMVCAGYSLDGGSSQSTSIHVWSRHAHVWVSLGGGALSSSDGDNSLHGGGVGLLEFEPTASDRLVGSRSGSLFGRASSRVRLATLVRNW